MENEKIKTSRASQTRDKIEVKKVGLHPTHSMHHQRQLDIDINGYELKYWDQDTKNVAASLREGWELVRADEYPDHNIQR